MYGDDVDDEEECDCDECVAEREELAARAVKAAKQQQQTSRTSNATGRAKVRVS